MCGSAEGMITLFDASDVSEPSDKFPGHPQSVDALAVVGDELLLSGSSDGVIRVLALAPNRMLGLVGVHSDWPVERLAVSTDGCMLASAVRLCLRTNVHVFPIEF